MPAYKQVKIGVSEATRARLQRLAVEIMEGVEKGHRADPGADPDPINPRTGAMSMEVLLNFLCDQVEAHRERTRKSNEKKKQARKKK